MKSFVLFIVFFCFIPVILLGQITYFSNNSTTNFNTLSGWSINANGTGANPPALTNTVRLVVQNGHTKNTSGTATVNRLTIQNGGIVTANNTITINGTNSQFEIQNGGTYIHNNTGSISNTIFNGDEIFGVSSTFQINNWQSNTTTLTPTALRASATSPLDGDNYYYGHLIINWAASGRWNQNWPSLPAVVKLTAGNFTINSVDELRVTDKINTNPDVYVAGNFVMNSTGSGADILDMAKGNFNTCYLNVYGNITHSNGSITASGNRSIGTIRTYKTGTSYWNYSGGTRSNLTYVLQDTKEVILTANFELGTNLIGEKKLLIGANAILDARQYVISNSSIAAYIENNGIIRTSNMNGLWTNGQTNRTVSSANIFEIYLMNGSTVEYYGAAGQLVSSLWRMTNSYNNYQNITLQSENTKILEDSITVEDVFNFTGSGNYLQIGEYNVTIDDDGSIINAGATSYFIVQPAGNSTGRLRQNNLSTDTRIFPIGIATNYLPTRITPVSSGSDFSVSVFRGTTMNGLSNGPGFKNRSNQVDAVWVIDRIAGAANAVIRLDWFNGSMEGSVFSSTANNQIGIWRYQSGNWSLTPSTPGPNFIADNVANNVATSGSVTSFGSEGTGLAYIVANVIVLPGELLSFSTDAKATYNLLKWKVADATQFSKFEIEVSKDAVSFTPFETVLATQQQDYLQTDRLHTQHTVYYRLKMWDQFNRFSYSNIVVAKRELAAGLVIVQNPVQQHLIFRHPPSQKASYMVIDFSGRLFLKGNIASGNLQTSLPVLTLPAGSYVLNYTDGITHFSQKFIK